MIHTLFSRTQSTQRGFTLIELLVSVSIFAALTTLLVVRERQFDAVVILQNLAYDIGLSIRESQNFGINVRVNQGDFDNPYGIHFMSATNTYMTFLDRNDNGVYDNSELLEQFTIGRGHRIETLCDYTTDCTSESDFFDTLDVVFKRPNPDALIRADGEDPLLSRARIELRSPSGKSRYIVVGFTGRVSVEVPQLVSE